MISTRTSGRNARVEKRGMAPFLILLVLAVGFGLPMAAVSQQIEVNVPATAAPGDTVQGSVVVTGAMNAGPYAVRLLLTNSSQGNSVVCGGTTFSAGDVADGGIGVLDICDDANIPNLIGRGNLLTGNVAATGGTVVLFNFELQLDCADGDTITMDFQPTDSPGGSTLGVNVDGTPRDIGGAGGLLAVGASIICGGTTPPPPPPCADTGYFIFDGLGGRHGVGIVPAISGPVYFGEDIAKDMEVATDGVGTVTDIIVLDQFGGATFVANAGDTPAQAFSFPDGTSQAVDVELAGDNAGFWVLRADGGIYAAGSALPSGADGSVPVASTAVALDFPFGGSVPRDPGPLTPAGDPDASVRAVGFVVVHGSGDPSAPTGIVVLDSQGGHYIMAGDGTVLDDDTADSILNGPGGSSETVYPFFPGLDIGRDIELLHLHPGGSATNGVAIYDGFGGVHPVPVGADASAVSFLRNDGSGGLPASTTGLPYLVLGFDDPATAADESDTSTYGVDSQSIFKDIEFCALGGGQPVGKGAPTGGSGGGVYVLDAFGGVFVFGSTRLGGVDDPTPGFTGGPYFFPNPIVRDLEVANELF